MKYRMEKKRVITLMYHDVVERASHQESGFGSADAGLYKLEPDQFEQHLAAIDQAVVDRPILMTDLLSAKTAPVRPWMITFDDGGASSYTAIADQLDALEWRAHFFITTDYINTPGFMTSDQIRELHNRGHVIGS